MDTELLIIDDESEIIIEVDTDVEVLEAAAQGPRGPQGIPGPAGGALRPGPWIDLRPYLNPVFIFEPTRAGKNNFPEGRVNNGFIELRGVVNYNVSAAAPASGVMLTLPPELRPAMTTGLVGFADVASPLYFGYATYIVVGATPYNMPGAQHGELQIINMPGGPATVTTQSFSLDGLRFAQG